MEKRFSEGLLIKRWFSLILDQFSFRTSRFHHMLLLRACQFEKVYFWCIFCAKLLLIGCAPRACGTPWWTRWRSSRYREVHCHLKKPAPFTEYRFPSSQSWLNAFGRIDCGSRLFRTSFSVFASSLWSPSGRHALACSSRSSGARVSSSFSI